MSNYYESATRFTAWTAIIGGVFAYMNVALAGFVIGDNLEMVFDGAAMLSLPGAERHIYRLAMYVDVLGFYLPVLAIGGYLWHVFRVQAGIMGDIALLAILVYVVLGVAGAAAVAATLHPLAELHAAGNEAMKSAAEASWSAVANLSQKGLWRCEGPVVLFWGMVIGNQLKQAGWGKKYLMPLSVVGWGFLLYFLTGFFPSLIKLTNVFLVLVVAIFPAWMMMFGFRLLKNPINHSPI